MSSANWLIFAITAAFPVGAASTAASTEALEATFEIGDGGAGVVLPHATSVTAIIAMIVALIV
jgi:hypothetical protein